MSFVACSFAARIGQGQAAMADSNLWLHLRGCNNRACRCRLYHKCFDDWARRLPLQKGCWDKERSPSENTWLSHSFAENGTLRWRCLLCHAAGLPVKSSLCVNLKFYTLEKHQRSQNHQRAVYKLFGANSVVAPLSSAPPRAMFSEVLKQFQDGLDPTGGVHDERGHCQLSEGACHPVVPVRSKPAEAAAGTGCRGVHAHLPR